MRGLYMNPKRTFNELNFLSDTDYTLFIAQLKGVCQRIRNGEPQETINEFLEMLKVRYPEVMLDENQPKAIKDYIVRKSED
jgi:hypothetical protein